MAPTSCCSPRTAAAIPTSPTSSAPAACVAPRGRAWCAGARCANAPKGWWHCGAVRAAWWTHSPTRCSSHTTSATHLATASTSCSPATAVPAIRSARRACANAPVATACPPLPPPRCSTTPAPAASLGRVRAGSRHSPGMGRPGVAGAPPCRVCGASAHLAVERHSHLCRVRSMTSFCTPTCSWVKKALKPATRTTRSRCFSGCFWASRSNSVSSTLN